MKRTGDNEPNESREVDGAEYTQSYDLQCIVLNVSRTEETKCVE